MDTVQKIYRLADLANVTKKIREIGLYTDNYRIPKSDVDLNTLLITMVREYIANMLPMCELIDDGSYFKIQVPKEIVDKLLFLENALYVHHYASPTLAKYLSEFTYLVSGLNTTQDVHVKIKKEINKLYSSPEANLATSLSSIANLGVFLSDFDERFEEYEGSINTFVQRSIERKNKLKALQEQVSDKKPISAFKAQAEKNKATLQNRLTNISQNKIEVAELEIEADLPTGTPVRVIRIPDKNLWVLYPPAPAVLPPSAVLVSDDDVIVKVTKSKQSLVYLTRSTYLCEYNDEYWKHGLSSSPSNKLYYNPEDSAFCVITSSGENIFFENYAMACDFVLQAGLDVNVQEVHINSSIEIIKGDD